MTDRDTLRDIVLRLEGSVNTGFQRVEGELSLLRRGEREAADDVKELRADVDELQSRRFPLPVIGGLVSVAALGMSAFTLVRGG